MAPARHESVNSQERAALVKHKARELGFGKCGITDLSPTPHTKHLTEWLGSGFAGTMAYMHRQAAKRKNPAAIVPGTTRAVVVTRNYFQPDPPPGTSGGKVAKYARGRDYHEALRPRLEQLAAETTRLGGPDTVTRMFVDAGPVPERELAQRAGLGWIGKNTMLIDPHEGSFFFIGSILTNADLAVDLPYEPDRCGSCRLCLDACPTGAFRSERVLDSTLCISYLTIEYRGNIEHGLADRMDRWVFGCDVCQDVCPWNHKFARPADDPTLQHDPQLATLDLMELGALSDEEFDHRYGWTALERAGREGMRRNAAIALGGGQPDQAR